MFGFWTFALVLTIARCEEGGTLPSLLKFFHESTNGNIGGLLSRFNDEFAGLLHESKDDNTNPDNAPVKVNNDLEYADKAEPSPNDNKPDSALNDNILKSGVNENEKSSSNDDNVNGKKSWWDKIKNIFVKKTTLAPSQVTSTPKTVTSEPDDNKQSMPVINVNLGMDDDKNKSVTIQIPINICIQNMIRESENLNGFEMKPSLRASDVDVDIPGTYDADAQDIALAKSFRDKIHKSKLEAQIKGELRRLLSQGFQNEDEQEEGVNLNV